MERSRVKLEWIVSKLGLSRSLYYRWRQKRKAGALEDIKPKAPDLNQVLAEEEEAVKVYALAHPRDGYRRLCWMMVDEDVVCLSPSSVYRILDRNDLLARWNVTPSVGRKPELPKRPHERWHTDLMYLWIAGRWYFFIGVLDGFSRYIVYWELLSRMTAAEVTDVVHAALDSYPGERPQIVNDNGSQFTSKDFRKLIKQFSLKQIRIRIHHPQSNGAIERFHRTLREEGLSDKELRNQLHAKDIIGEWIDIYNTKRLHAGIEYLTPEDRFLLRHEERKQVRLDKLENARKHRRGENLKRLGGSSCQIANGGSAPEPPGFSALSGTGLAQTGTREREHSA